LVKEFPAQRITTDEGELLRGLPVRLSLSRQAEGVAVEAQIQLGDKAKFFPTDAALAGWIAQADGGQAVIAYD
jgi:DNA polymerase-3 subunit alpha